MSNYISLKSNGFKALLITQFLGAFNDNAFKLVISLLAVNLFADQPGGGTQYVALAGAMLVIPFLLFSSYAGFIADRYSKTTIIFWIKVGEVLVMSLGFAAFLSGSIKFMLVVLFLMGTQSAFFSPSKYGILPEMFAEKDLSSANGSLQLWSFLSMILGTLVGGQLLLWFDYKVHLTSIIFISVAIFGVISSRFIAYVPPSASTKSFEINFLKDIYLNFTEIKESRAMYLCVIGNAYFWFLCALYQMNILIYAKTVMHIGDAGTSILLASIGFGVAIGSVLAGRFSEEKIEFGLVPIGAIGLGIFSMFLGITHGSFFATVITFFLFGTSCGFFIIPLATYIQQFSPADGKGRILATSNFISFASMALASVVFWFLASYLRVSPALIFVIFGVLSFFVIIYICKLLPDFLIRFVIFLMTHTLYKIRIIGKENIPKTGGALLVCNHVSFADGCLVVACTQRMIRFMSLRSLFKNKFLRPLFFIMKSIPIADTDGPKKLLESFAKVGEHITNGEMVCIFAEGAITRTGNMQRFEKGMERIMKKVDSPIIPVHLDRVWGSIFSFEGNDFFNKVPSQIPYPVTISFGKPMPPKSTSSDVRAVVSEMGADAYQHRPQKDRPLPLRFYSQAKKNPARFCMADSSGVELSYAKTFIGSMAFARAIRRRCPDDKMIGLMLPNNVGAALVNIGISLLGKCPVNLNFTASEESVSKSIGKCGITHIFSSREFVEKVKIKKRDEMIWIEDFKNDVSSSDKFIATLCFYLLPGRLMEYLYKNHDEAPSKSLATVIFSSGSTGDPKGVMLTHANIGSNIEGLFQVFHTSDDDKVMGILPLFHSFGFSGTLWYPLLTGMGVIYHHNPLDFKVIGELVKRYKTTVLMATPTFLMGFIRKCTPEQFHSLRHVVVGAEKLKDRVAAAFEKRFGLYPLEGFGCTELSPIVSVNIPDVNIHGTKQKGTKVGSIGHPLPNITTKIVDPDSYEELGVGVDGLLLVKGPNVMLGYLGDEEKTNEVMRDGWYITGDIAVMDEDGFLTIKDRLSRFSKIGGEMVPHIKIEEEIHEKLGIDSEQICAVTSLPDERKGESLAVLYKGDIDIEQLTEQLKQSELPNLWIPKKDSYFMVDEIPMLGSGKLDLKKIKAMAVELSQRSQKR